MDDQAVFIFPIFFSMCVFAKDAGSPDVVLGQAYSTLRLPCSLPSLPDGAVRHQRLDLAWYRSDFGSASGPIAKEKPELGPVAKGKPNLGPVAKGKPNLGPVTKGEPELGPFAWERRQLGPVTRQTPPPGPISGRRPHRGPVTGRRPHRGPVSRPLLMTGSDGVVRRGREGPAPRTGLAGAGGPASGDFSLLLRRARPGDSGTFRCQARLGARSLDKALTLVVVEVIPRSQEPFVEGGNVVLLCSIPAGVGETVVVWYRLGKPVIPNLRIAVKDAGKRLEIRELETGDNGIWECRVRYGETEIGIPYTIRMVGFLGSPLESKTYYSSSGSPVNISLPLFPSALPSPIEWGWRREGGELRNLTGGRFRAWVGEGGLELMIHPVLESDQGVYLGYVCLPRRCLNRTVHLEIGSVQVEKMAMSAPYPRKIAVLSLFCGILVVVLIFSGIVAAFRIRSRRHNFPALEVTLNSGETLAKKT